MSYSITVGSLSKIDLMIGLIVFRVLGCLNLSLRELMGAECVLGNHAKVSKLGFQDMNEIQLLVFGSFSEASRLQGKGKITTVYPASRNFWKISLLF